MASPSSELKVGSPDRRRSSKDGCYLVSCYARIYARRQIEASLQVLCLLQEFLCSNNRVSERHILSMSANARKLPLAIRRSLASKSLSQKLQGAVAPHGMEDFFEAAVFDNI
jgi:hypothetical protein